MSPAIFILVIAAALFIVVSGVLALFIIGIRREDRGCLADDPGSCLDAVARRALLRVSRYSGGEEQ